MNFKDAWSLLRRHLAPRRQVLLRLLGWSLIQATPSFASGILLAAALDRGFLAQRPVEGLAWLALFGVAMLVSAFATRQLYPWLARTVEPMRDSLLTAAVAGSLSQAVAGEEVRSGVSLVQATSHVEAVRDVVSALLRTLRQLVLPVVAAVAGLAVLAPVVAAIVVPLIVFALTIYVRALPGLLSLQRDAVVADEHLGAESQSTLSALRDIVACAAEPRAADSLGDAIDATRCAARRLARANTVRVLVVALGSQIPVVVLLACSPWLLGRGYVTIGALAGAVLYLAMNVEPALRSLVHLGGTWVMRLGVVLTRLASVCESAAANSRAVPAHPHGNDLELRDVTFAYAATAQPVIEDMNVRIPFGDHVAVVGASGSGKSTLANLLIGLLVPQRGAVLIGGAPTRRLAADVRRKRIALIPQEAYVFAGTLQENLAYLRPDATAAEVDRVVGIFAMEGVVERCGGLDGEIASAEATLSAGERQLIALARVYLSAADVVILDEATCHLDPVGEARAEMAFAQRDGTLLVIAHRISSALRAHQILVMDGARAHFGSHDTLLTNCVAYADLVGYWESTPTLAAG